VCSVMGEKKQLVEPRTLKGFQDLLPEQVIPRQRLLRVIESVFERYGYAPLETPLLEAARARGNRTADGLSMLLHQAAFGYRAWLGEKAVVDADIRRVLEAEIARRAA